ncbi:tRNA lysidine(34) synthetase TilS [Propylenella binzhouense]|uniref:tRNA(Ile)-lysidine synthase n=1 Tax=Propylenella binzhouense TaxID=2555902 RepID=A0A964T465_9HYPH|nr:tRNA lysidine(34) synthetase TilS [Propylenella binzhouense]MYZ48143.1 tRNA lysidine(34) synthetase TilS [Propylenella binzhouense]
MSRPGTSAAEPRGGLPAPSLLFSELRGTSGLVLAVSGGPDSTALMLLVSRWNERPPVLVATVDHGLRPESAAEAGTVAANAARLGLSCRVLRLGRLPAGNRQAAARSARYRALADLAREVDAEAIVTAHHREDQAETFLMRIARGSGVYGLGAMRPMVRTGDIAIARPLLGVSRSALHRLASASGLPLAGDPSNEDERYERVRMRRLQPALDRHGLDAERLAGTADRLARAADALDACCERLVFDACSISEWGSVTGPLEALTEAHEEIAERSLARMLAAVAGADYTPEHASIGSLLGALAAGPAGERVRRTLHGAVVTASGGLFEIRREWGRAGLPTMPARPAETIVWDGRFRISVPNADAVLEIAPIGLAAPLLAFEGMTRGAARTLPAILRDGRLAALPAGLRPVRPAIPVASFEAACLVRERLHRSTV